MHYNTPNITKKQKSHQVEQKLQQVEQKLQQVEQKTRNKELEVIDSFIESNNIKLLFDLINEVSTSELKLNQTESQLIDNIVDSFLNTSIKWFINQDHRNYLCKLLFLVRETETFLNCYNKHKQDNLSMYIIGDYIFHRIKHIPKLDKYKLFPNFLVSDEKSKDKTQINALLTE